jgi:hypothetical protein
MAEPDHIVIQHLRAIREQMDTLNGRQLEMMQRLGTVEVGLANLPVRVDRIDVPLDRIERRLGLIDA